MPWSATRMVFASLFIDEVEAVAARGGEALVREKRGALSDEARRVLRQALAHAP